MQVGRLEAKVKQKADAGYSAQRASPLRALGAAIRAFFAAARRSRGSALTRQEAARG